MCRSLRDDPREAAPTLKQYYSDYRGDVPTFSVRKDTYVDVYTRNIADGDDVAYAFKTLLIAFIT